MPWQNVGSPFIVISPANGIFLVYELPGPGLGTLIASIAPMAGVDQYGNTYNAGVAEYVTVNSQLYAVTLNQNLSTDETNGAGLSVAAVGANAPFAAGGIFAISSNTQNITTLTTGQNTNTDFPVFIYLYSNASNVQDPFGLIQLEAGLVEIVGGALQIDGPVNGVSNGATDAACVGMAPGMIALAYENANPNDTNVYTFGDNHKISTANQVVNSVLGQINNMSVPVVAGQTYDLELLMIWTGNQAGGVAKIQFAGTATGSIYGVQGFDGAGGFNLIANSGPYVGPTLTNGGNGNMSIFGSFTCATTGTLQVKGQCSVVGDTFTMKYSKLRLSPCDTT